MAGMELIIAGFGGQGILCLGEILPKAAVLEGKQATWMPSYGPEQRGGTATCTVVIADEPIGSPVVADPPGVLILNRPSMAKFEARAPGGGLLTGLVGGVGCPNVGHRHPRVVAAIQAQAARLSHSDFSIVPYEEYVALAERLVAGAPGPSPKQAALFNSGAEAVENAVKIARLATGRSAVLAFEGAFHGRTYMALSLTGRIDPYKRGLGPFAPEVYRAPYPDPYRLPVADPVGSVLGGIGRMFHTTVDAQALAAIIVEPVLGGGGVGGPPPAP